MKLSSILPRLFASAALFASIMSCSENLDSSGVCNVLCPPIGGNVNTVTIEGAVEVDTTVMSGSGLGTESGLFLANRGDTLDSRVIVRFDSLPQTFLPTGDTTQAIQTVDSAYLLLRVDTLTIKGPGPVTIEAYDVDTTADDTANAAVLALFRPDRFISSQTFARADLSDSTKYFISNATVLSKIQNKQPLRIGLRATGAESIQMIISSTEVGLPPTLFFRATPDTATKPLTVTPFSKTPADDPILAFNIRDYTVIAKAPPAAPPGTLVVGGFPSHRVYFRFVVPSAIVDSTTVVRATLILNQISNGALDPTDTLNVLPQVSLAGIAVTDPTKAAQIIGNIAADTLRLRPGDAGTTNVELAHAFALWRSIPPDTLPRAIILKPVIEGSPLELRFSSSEDPVAGLRPQLRISYTTKVPLGLP
ncbi:MAG: hypothetical protein ACJ79Q_04615 [Gemmatimonadaceae bacterium]